MLKQWLSAGYMEKEVFHDTLKGTPQGGIASPCLANIALDGLERAIQALGGKEGSTTFREVC